MRPRSICRFTVLAMGACGRVAFDPRADGLAAWSPPVLVGELSSSASDDDPTLPFDMLEIYFASTRAGGLGSEDIWVATRASSQDPWGPPSPVAIVNSSAEETTPEISGDGLTLYLSSDRLASGNQEVYLATRPTRAAPWSPPARVAELSSSDADESPAIASDGVTLYLDSERLSPGIDKIFVATRPSPADVWSVPTVIGELDASGEEENPFPEATGLALWAAVKQGADHDLYVATRSVATEPWGAWTRVDELASPQDDVDPWVSDDGRTLFMASTRSGRLQIYSSTR